MPAATSTSEPSAAEAVNPSPRLGLALGGGVARAPAHLGALAVLETAGVPIACVAGSSAGAIVGAIFCAGVTLARTQELVGTFNWWRIARPVWPRTGFVSFDRLETWLADLIGDIGFADLRLPFAVVATDLETGEPVILRDGPVARAVHASCAVPSFVEPVAVAGRLLGDGGVSNNLPVDATRALGATYVVGVDLFRPSLRRSWGPLAFGVAALENLVRRSGGGIEAADFLICPDLAGESYFRFQRRLALVEIGARAAEAQLPEIWAALGVMAPGTASKP
ncbi:MAG: patatin-like phospholipase family protein [Anaerolineales bacterium]|nr:patatin-like phospholipase family protein [Anaerolineales bacterium]